MACVRRACRVLVLGDERWVLSIVLVYNVHMLLLALSLS